MIFYTVCVRLLMIRHINVGPSAFTDIFAKLKFANIA